MNEVMFMDKGKKLWKRVECVFLLRVSQRGKGKGLIVGMFVVCYNNKKVLLFKDDYDSILMKRIMF